jgi:hypothetical protein
MATYRYSPGAGRFRDAATGRFVPEGAVREAVDQVVDAGTERIAGLTRQLQAGALPLARWQVGVASELKALHVATAMVANGGRASMAPGDYGRVGARLREQYQFLGRFAADVASGTQPLDGRLLARAGLYGQAARAGFEAERRRLAGIRGQQAERNILHARESCAECREQTRRGWVPFGSLVPIGERICLTRCKCTLGYRQAAA